MLTYNSTQKTKTNKQNNTVFISPLVQAIFKTAELNKI